MSMEHLSPQREKKLLEVEKKLGTSFHNTSLLNQSLTHSSYGHENKIPDNERMEFLGDAVLKLVVSEFLFHKFPERAEGDLTKIRAAVISDETLATVGRKLYLGDYLLLSANEQGTGGTRRKSNLANTFEAVLGAVFIDAGIGKSRELVLNVLTEEIDKVSKEGYIRDYKSALQEYTQKQKWELPRYKVVKEAGPKHRKVFWMEVKIRGRRYGLGRGGNKKESEQRAAMQALKALKAEQKNGGRVERRGLKGIISQVRKKIKI
ncbi:ribonuclease III [Candidatus Falkowbacteria bacterium RIFCSPLOWO2_12_FULL_45_13]|uniref:Ribonuclease 3 n=2 Tax=Bacteria TaxID=2 RepID=A0A1F4RAS4_UNCSA|nr:MAG: ribonuclease III [candidate division WOR-1 bacterium RIFCSPHIGHO2_02_FULL_45_12]OGC05291.1 MAG: ribonuclease III [candidate division WOR-1 bacterium RIFCSPLOWO2_02_FULL_46_20]OGF32100.1 MAG: ribonuclease III [Candidatus Falkowbacteria bacterium RIFCSPLOWO2_12_FULL_45_13]